MPKEVKMAGALIIIALLIHPKSREKILVVARKDGRSSPSPLRPIAPIFSRLLSEYLRASHEAIETRVQIEQKLPPRQRFSAISLAKRVCLRSHDALELRDLACKIRAARLHFSFARLEAYLRRNHASGPIICAPRGRALLLVT